MPVPTGATGRSKRLSGDVESRGQYLDLRDISLSFGGTQALNDVSLSIRANLITGLIGPNGAGKTSLLNCICGYYRPDSGSVTFRGVNTTRMSIARIASLGIGRTFQIPQLSAGMNVLENVMLGLHRHTPVGLVAATLPWRKGKRLDADARHSALEVLHLLDIADQAERPIGELSFAQQKVVEVARAVATQPALLLLDEPASGMSTDEKQHIADLITRLRNESGITPLIIEHDVGFIERLCDRLVVLDFGELLMEGSPAEVLSDPRIVEVYLGPDPKMSGATTAQRTQDNKGDVG